MGICTTESVLLAHFVSCSGHENLAVRVSGVREKVAGRLNRDSRSQAPQRELIGPTFALQT